MNLKNYQLHNIDKLFSNIVDQLNEVGSRRKIVFQAPTGSGKTVMATETMRKLALELKDTDCQYRKVAFIWIAPNALHIQSYLKMKSAFSETNILEPVVYDELDLSFDGYIRPSQVFFVNWQSINKEKNLMVRGSEQTPSIYDIIDRTRQENIAIVCVIDEEHMFGGKNANKSEKVLERMQPKVELRISATPTTRDEAAKITISRSSVISEGMIKQNISLNPAIRQMLAQSDDERLNLALLREALNKRDEIAKKYKKLGININPLLLIQLPNDDSDDMTREEVELKELLINALSVNHGISRENNKLAVWLADEKYNLDGIEKNDALVNVLLFKQAIALGWDCPRAAVLLIFRRLSSFTFTIQTVGRIMRMPEQRFYGNALLDIGYVYTDLSADRIHIEPDDANYINKLHSFLRQDIESPCLTTFKEGRSNKENNILRSDFRKLLRKRIGKEWLDDWQTDLQFFEEDLKLDGNEFLHETNRIKARKKGHIEFDVSRIQIEIPTDMELCDEQGDYYVREKAGYARTMDELEQVFDQFCGSMLGGWSKSKALPVLESALYDAMELYFGLSNWQTLKVVLYHLNKERFRELITKALKYYKDNMLVKLTARQLNAVEDEWTLPAERIYSDSTFHECEKVKNHALLPFYEFNRVYSPEQRFTDFLEANSKYIDWWYKNGDSGAENFAIQYQHSDGRFHLFFVDYIIRMKNGTVCLFDTKSSGGDAEAVNKHNALIDYVKTESEKRDQKIIGGIIVEDNDSWRYSSMYIENVKELAGWNSFFPDHYLQ